MTTAIMTTRIPAELLAELDAEAARLGMTRSQLVRTALEAAKNLTPEVIAGATTNLDRRQDLDKVRAKIDRLRESLEDLAENLAEDS